MKKIALWFAIIMLIIGIFSALSLTSCEATTETTAAATTAAETTAAETTAAATTAAETTAAWVPYYKTADFKSYVELPMNTKKESGDILDEMTVMPVDRVAPETLRFAYLGGSTNPFWDIIREGVDAAAEVLAIHNVTVEWILPGVTLSSADYGEAISTLKVKGYNVISGFILNEGMIPYVDDTVDAGILYTCSIADTQPNKSLFFIGQDAYNAGIACADFMAKEIGGKGKVAIITGNFNVVQHEARRLGFVDTIAEKYPDIEIVGAVENQDQAEKALTQAKDFMTANPDLAGIYVTAGGPIGAAQAVEDVGKIGEVKVVCYDPLPQTIEYIKKGSIIAAIGQNPYAESRDCLVRAFNYLMEGTLLQWHNLFTRNDLVTVDNLDAFYASGQKG